MWIRASGKSLPVLRRCRKASKRGHTKAQRQSNNERDRKRRNDVIFTSTVQLMLGDMVWTKANAFQGKRKMEYRWDEVEYEIACQVTNGSPSYEMKESSGKVRMPHCNRFFQVAIPQGASTALCQSMYANVDPTTRSARWNLLLWSVTLICQEILWKSDFPNAQPVLVHLDRWMAYDDHYLWWS